MRIKLIPNTLSIIRLIGSLICLFIDKQTTFFIFLILGLTDILDGWFARKFNCVSIFGNFLDKVADRTMLYIMGAISGINIYIFLFIILRDYIYSSGRELVLSKALNERKTINLNVNAIYFDKVISVILFLYLDFKIIGLEKSSLINTYLFCSFFSLVFYLINYLESNKKNES